MWNHAKKSMKQLERPTSLISHWFPMEMVDNGPKLYKRKRFFLCGNFFWGIQGRGERERLFGSREREGKLEITFPFYGKGTGIRKCYGKGTGIRKCDTLLKVYVLNMTLKTFDNSLGPSSYAENVWQYHLWRPPPAIIGSEEHGLCSGCGS